MNEELKAYEKAIKRTHCFGWTPKYEESFYTNISKGLIIQLIIKCFEKLDWDILFIDDSSVEAKRKNTWDRWTEKITVTYENKDITVRSVSLGNEMWDAGKNSLRVKLFIRTFKELHKELEKNELEELKQAFEKEISGDNYKFPETLPEPHEWKEPNFSLAVAGGVISAVSLGYLMALAVVEGLYVILIFELAIGFILGILLKYLIRFSNYTNYRKLKYILIGMIFISLISNQYFQLHILAARRAFTPTLPLFYQFIKYKFELGLTIEEINTGQIGLIIGCILQFIVIFYFSMLSTEHYLSSFILERIPVEVRDFAYYHFIKGKTEDQARIELAKKGWDNPNIQDEVFESVGAFSDSIELSRME